MNVPHSRSQVQVDVGGRPAVAFPNNDVDRRRCASHPDQRRRCNFNHVQGINRDESSSRGLPSALCTPSSTYALIWLQLFLLVLLNARELEPWREHWHTTSKIHRKSHGRHDTSVIGRAWSVVPVHSAIIVAASFISATMLTRGLRAPSTT